MTLKEMLADAQKYPDTLEIPISEGFKVSMKDLREYQSLANAAEVASKKKGDDADSLAAKAADLIAQVQARATAEPAREPAAAAPAEPDYASDPLLGPMFRRLTGLEQKIAKEYADKLDGIQKSLNTASQRYLKRELEQDFAAIPDRFEDVNLRDVVKYAVDNRELDDMGMPRIRKAYDAMTAERRLKKIEEDAYKRGQEEARRNLPATEGMVLRPGSGMGRIAADTGAQVHKGADGRASLDAAFDAAYGDRELMNQLQQVLNTGAIQ